MGAWHFLKIITSPVWLKSACPYYLSALPIFILPAALFTLASIGVHFANGFAFAQFTEKEIGLPNLLVALAVFFMAFVVGTPLLIYALVRWMFSISVFTQYWLSGPFPEATPLVIEERKQNATAIVKVRQKYLTSYWLCCSIFTVIPAFLAMALLTIKAYVVWQPTSFSSNLVALIDYVLCPLGCLLGAFSLVSSFVAIPLSMPGVSMSGVSMPGLSMPGLSASGISVSGVSAPAVLVPEVPASQFSGGEASSAKQDAWRAFRLSIKFFPQAFVCVLILGTIHTIVDNPELLYKPDAWLAVFNPQDNPVKLVLTELWQGLTSVIFVPLSVVPLCEMLRSEVDESDQIGKR
jgi:hypothetical protein